ncbi:hypothetical protein KIN20_038406 [Parelaphostrongylus tenuis]|uniref:Endonuclease-reverse transcriptase n=1 Tax=Parelaphostrongylus tenuis TaxID=148309 RepID=A0AAD5MFU5_PARTN|nr:hypothetical protein KIN20_038406 [Parelaphostrongylus tenuis]
MFICYLFYYLFSKKTKNIRLRAHLFDSTIIPALTYASETWSLLKQNEISLGVIERAVQRSILGLGVSRISQIRERIQSYDLCQRSKIKNAFLHARISKIRWAGHVMRFNGNRWTRVVPIGLRDIKRSSARPQTRWSDFFTKGIEERYDAQQIPRARGPTKLLLHAIWKNGSVALVPVQVTRRSTGRRVIQVNSFRQNP